MNLFAASSYESLLIALGIILLSAVSNWVQRRRQAQGRKGGTEEAKTAPVPPASSRDPRTTSAPAAPVPGSAPPPSPTGPKPARRLDWEEELRRLLEGNLEPAPSPQPQPPLPVPVPASREAALPPALPPATKAEEVEGLSHLKGRCAHCGGHFEFPSATAGETILCPHCGRPTQLVPLPAPSLPPVMSSKGLASLRESAQAFQRASQSHGQIGDRLRRTEARTEHPSVAAPLPYRTATSTEIIETMGLLRHPRSARQLMIASVVLGPPRALEGYRWTHFWR